MVNKQQKLDNSYVKCFAEMLINAIDEYGLDIDEVKATLEGWKKDGLQARGKGVLRLYAVRKTS